MNSKANFKNHMTKVVNRCRQVSAWLLRTFRNRNLSFLRFLIKTYICAHLDYGLQIWAPTKLQEIDSLESIVRAWTRKAPALKEFHH